MKCKKLEMWQIIPSVCVCDPVVVVVDYFHFHALVGVLVRVLDVSAPDGVYSPRDSSRDAPSATFSSAHCQKIQQWFIPAGYQK